MNDHDEPHVRPTLRAKAPGDRVRHTPTGERGHPMPAGSTGTIVGYAAQGWAIVRWDRGGQALTHPGDITSDESPPPTTGAGSAQRK